MTTSGPFEPESSERTSDIEIESLVRLEVARIQSESQKTSRRQSVKNALFAIGGLAVGVLGTPLFEAYLDDRRKDSHSFNSALSESSYSYTREDPEAGTLGDPWRLPASVFQLSNDGDFTENNIRGTMIVKPITNWVSNGGFTAEKFQGMLEDGSYRELINFIATGLTIQSSLDVAVVADPIPDYQWGMELSCSFTIPRIVRDDGITLIVTVPFGIVSARVEGQSDEILFQKTWEADQSELG